MNYIKHTKNWIKSLIIPLQLCPFAKYPFENKKIRYQVYESDAIEPFLLVLEKELKLLESTSREEIETTFLIHPHLFQDFFQYNDFLSIADHLIFALQLEGTIQIASFHPDYQFADAAKEAVGNYTNRSPYPMLHLLREESITRAIELYGDTNQIPIKNDQTLQRLGVEKIKGIIHGITRKD